MLPKSSWQAEQRLEYRVGRVTLTPDHPAMEDEARGGSFRPVFKKGAHVALLEAHIATQANRRNAPTAGCVFDPATRDVQNVSDFSRRQ
jgi:hypothetical protein